MRPRQRITASSLVTLLRRRSDRVCRYSRQIVDSFWMRRKICGHARIQRAKVISPYDVMGYALGGVIGFIICVVAAVTLYGTGHPVLFWLSVATGLVDLWSWGVMHNHAMESAKARHNFDCREHGCRRSI